MAASISSMCSLSSTSDVDGSSYAASIAIKMAHWTLAAHLVAFKILADKQGCHGRFA